MARKPHAKAGMSRMALLLLLALPVAAQEVTPFLGLQAGGALLIDGEEYRVDAGPAFGVTLGFDRGRGRVLDVLVARQQSEAGPADVAVHVVQAGGRYYLRRERFATPYIAATIGATHIAAGQADALALSFAGGGGVDLNITPGLAIRFDGRLYTSLFGDRASFDCRNNFGCATETSGRLFQQFIGSAGLAIRF